MTHLPYIRSGELIQPGQSPSCDPAVLVAFTLGTTLFCGLALLFIDARRPWYDRKRLVETGTGPLYSHTVGIT